MVKEFKPTNNYIMMSPSPIIISPDFLEQVQYATFFPLPDVKKGRSLATRDHIPVT